MLTITPYPFDRTVFRAVTLIENGIFIKRKIRGTRRLNFLNLRVIQFVSIYNV